MQLSDSELEVLKALWEKNPLSARELHDELAARTGWAVSTTRTVLERMRAKELVTRSEAHGLAVFTPATTKVEVLGNSLSHLFRHVLEVPGSLPVSALTGSAILNADELAELDRMLNGRKRKS
ncbi:MULTISPECIES: BlaI/MecI/CopY family transcriptional regulator [unclassified Luteibacter]|uniref:BlaI/MecI/CopY family transcriptional regulator n=1 Tax=unclassified Luteibacter TaxID=2620188 RepID=UPI0005BDE5F8|nr:MULTISPECIES: BlaI/MecI/CopY family transcriptional regulator [unclassified Luteibacter]MDR6640914.1 putative transcriptional regulator [Luteibacter sp. 1214]SKB27607.1 Predicted transcriptional regulator [Luteibacter sp. 22Crub2.1]